jgi:hypothetical protein
LHFAHHLVHLLHELAAGLKDLAQPGIHSAVEVMMMMMMLRPEAARHRGHPRPERKRGHRPATGKDPAEATEHALSTAEHALGTLEKLAHVPCDLGEHVAQPAETRETAA